MALTHYIIDTMEYNPLQTREAAKARKEAVERNCSCESSIKKTEEIAMISLSFCYKMYIYIYVGHNLNSNMESDRFFQPMRRADFLNVSRKCLCAGKASRYARPSAHRQSF